MAKGLAPEAGEKGSKSILDARDGIDCLTRDASIGGGESVGLQRVGPKASNAKSSELSQQPFQGFSHENPMAKRGSFRWINPQRAKAKFCVFFMPVPQFIQFHRLESAPRSRKPNPFRCSRSTICFIRGCTLPDQLAFFHRARHPHP